MNSSVANGRGERLEDLANALQDTCSRLRGLREGKCKSEGRLSPAAASTIDFVIEDTRVLCRLSDEIQGWNDTSKTAVLVI